MQTEFMVIGHRRFVNTLFRSSALHVMFLAEISGSDILNNLLWL